MGRKRKHSRKKSSVFRPRKYPNDFIFNMVDNGQLQEFCEATNEDDIKNHKDPWGDSYLHRVLYQCTYESELSDVEGILSYLLTTAPCLTDVKNDKGETPLNLACKIRARLSVIRQLVDCNTDALNITDDLGNTPLHHLLSQIGNLPKSNNPSTSTSEAHQQNIVKIEQIIEIIELFISKGININHENKYGISAIFNLVKQNSLHVTWEDTLIKILVDNGANVRTANGEHNLLKYLLLDCTNNVEKYEIIKYITDKNPDIVNDGKSLKYAIKSKCLDKNKIIKLLINNIENEHINLAIKYKCDFEIIEILLSKCKNFDINTQDEKGKTIIMHYCTETTNIKKLISLGANINIKDNKNRPLLYYVTEYNLNIDLIKYLIESGAEINNFLEYGNNSNILESKSILTNILEKVLNEESNDWLQLYKYILNTPQFKDPSLPNDLEGILMCSIADMYYYFCQSYDYEHKIEATLKAIANCNSEINNIKHELFTNVFRFYIKVPLTLNPIAYVILFSTVGSNCKNLINLNAFIIKMLKFGFTLKSSENCITPLTALFLTYKFSIEIIEGNFKINIFKNLVLKFIKNNVNIKSLELSKTNLFNNNSNDSYKSLKIAFKIPDILILCRLPIFKQLEPKWFDIFMSYWDGPSFAFFYFEPELPLKEIDILENVDYIMNTFAEYLDKYEITDLDMKLLSKIHGILECCEKAEMPEEQRTLLESYIRTVVTCMDQQSSYSSSPRSLKFLSKYAVRRAIADTPHGVKTLSEIVQTLPLPPLIKKLVIS